ncbi:carboxypeptidase regulatory-like domain-containing protein [Edaphobacter bradus]|uniref:carboxypeptidase regulatory-like domain-containing protein n=1 Tax=Edaphobacter bradus TaxID=2259016 RepID=UPI0021E0CF0B|nr:carboxypeptidase regulatory-like domain-containing protein [Edaphobacter bradus]
MRFISSLVAAGCLSAVAGFAQNTNSADLRGTVTDATGAAIAGATVSVQDVDKGITRTLTTDAAGVYDTGSIVPDHYLVTISAPGFKTLVRGPVTLLVGIETVNGQLPIGGVQEQVVVTEDLPLLDTESGSQSNTMTSATMSELPQYGADWQNFVNTLPGVSYSFRSGQTASVNGNLPYNSVLADGATTTLPMSENADVTVFETTAEVKVDTSSFSAQYGLGGVIFNQVSKSGSNHWHGAAYEYLQNTALNTTDYRFDGKKNTAGFQRYDNYGFSVSGPILRDKLFFYFNFDKTYSNGGSAAATLTVPTDAMRAGDFTGLPTLYDPSTQTIQQTGTHLYPGQDPTKPTKCPCAIRTSFADEYGNGNKIPASMIDPVANAINAYYPKANVPGHTGSNGLPANNYSYEGPPNLNPFTKFFGRLDYTPVAYHRITISETESDNPATYLNQNLCPINCQHGDVSRDNAQISDVWTISPNIINEARFGFTDQLNYFTPFSINQGFPSKLGLKFAKADLFPNINVSGIYGLASASNAVYKEFVFDPSDVVTLIRGRHVLHFGGEFLISRADSTAWGNLDSSTIGFNGNYTAAGNGQAGTSGTGYADFLLGYAQNWNAKLSPEYGARIKTPQAFVQDDIKLRPNLTVNLGLRWQGTTGWSEVKGNIASFDPTVTNPADGSLGAAWYANTKANGRSQLQAPVWSTFLPRVGVSYSLDPKTVLRGGFGLFAYTWSSDTYGNGLGNAFGINLSTYRDSTSGISPVVLLSSDGNTNYQGSAGHSINSLFHPRSGPDGYNGTGMSYNQYHTPVPKIYQYNFSVQREIGSSMVAQAAYVGSHGYNLNFGVDINQVPESKLASNDALPGPTNARPYPLFQGLGGSTNNAISNYNSLQLSFEKRMSRGLNATANYTWSHFLDDQDSAGWGSSVGSTHYQRAYCVSCNYGPSNFDIRHMFNVTAIYQLPFGKNGLFLNHNSVVDAVVGGWQLSTIARVNTGTPFTPTMQSNTGSYAQAGDWYPNQVGDPHLANPGRAEWFNVSAFAQPANGTFGNIRRNSLRGPGYSIMNLSLEKSFSISEKAKLQIRADAQNFLNHASLGNPNATIGNGGAGTINGTTTGSRHIQLFARVSF